MDMVPDQVLGIFHRHKEEFISILKASVLAESQFEVLPEVLDIFGDEAIKFLEIFSGRVISVPPIRDLVSRMRHVSVWVALGNAFRATDDEALAVAAVASRLSMKKSEVRQIHKSMGKLMEQLALDLRPDDGEEEKDS